MTLFFLHAFELKREKGKTKKEKIPPIPPYKRKIKKGKEEKNTHTPVGDDIFGENTRTGCA